MTNLSSHTWLGIAGSMPFMAKPLSEVLSGTLEKLMEERPADLGSQPKIVARAKAKGRRIGQRTVGRAVKGKASTTIGSIEVLGVAAGLEPWQLLHPELGRDRPVLDPEERALIDIFRASSPSWKKVIANLAAFPITNQSEEALQMIGRIFQSAVTPERAAEKLPAAPSTEEKR